MLPGPTFVKTFLRSYAEVLGLDPHVLVEEYRATYEPRDEIEQLQPLGPPGLRRERRRPGPPRGPWLLIGLSVLLVVGTLLVIGLLSEEEDPGDSSAAQETETEPRQQRTEREEPPPPPTRVVLRIEPEAETYVCLDTGPGTPIRFEGILTEPQTFRGRRLRVNLGNTSVSVTVNGEQVDTGGGAEPVGFAFTPGGTRALPLGERPCA